MPNLLNFLSDYDPGRPVYFGSSLGTHYAANAYMQGLGYGFSWPLVGIPQPKNHTLATVLGPIVLSC